jgi:Tfp pilus assembly protein PilO
VGLTLLGSAILFETLLCPAWADLVQQRDTQQARSQEFARLKGNLAVGRQIGQRFNQLTCDVVQDQSEESTLSAFLRDLETRCREANLTLASMRPMAVKKGRSLRQYPVRLAVSGRLQDLLAFLSAVSAGPGVTGIEGFSIRGIHGSDKVECQFSLWMVRLVGAKFPSGPSSQSSTSRSAGATQGAQP